MHPHRASCESRAQATRRSASTTLFWLPAAVLAMLATVAACNTMEGAGEDIEAAGDAIQDAADGD
mgnify:CR=1 FL=1